MEKISTNTIIGDTLGNRLIESKTLSVDAVVNVFNEAISEINSLGGHLNEVSCVADAEAGHAEGYQTSTMCTASHSEGYQTIVYPYEMAGGVQIDMPTGHAEGYQTSCNAIGGHVEGGVNIVKGQYAHVGGCNCDASGARSFVHGLSCSDGDKADSIALGVNAEGRKNSFVWNGDDGYVKVNDGKRYGNQFKLDADGVFAVNPKLGVDGFYIGNTTLNDIINKAVESALKTKESETVKS